MKRNAAAKLAAVVLGAALWTGCDRQANPQQPTTPAAAGQPATRPATQPVAEAVNKFCPVMPDDPIDPQVTYVHNGKTYAFCCDHCIDDFKKDPEKYAKAAK